MDLKQIEYFVRVAEMGSFTKAAIALNVAQPALSRQIRLLEVELRQNLLRRNGRGASPTEAGLLLLEHGRGILHQVERAQEEMGRARSSLNGRVALGLPPSVARVLTVPLTRAFREKMPEAQLSISEGLTNAMQESLLNGRLDIALLYNMKGKLDAEAGPVDIDRAAIRRAGKDISLITYGGSLHKTLRAAEELAALGISAEVVDLRVLRPLDDATIMTSVRKCRRAVVVDEAWRSGSLAAEVMARIAEQAFFDLDAPLARVCSEEVPIPYARHMEEAALPQVPKIVAAAQAVMGKSA